MVPSHIITNFTCYVFSIARSLALPLPPRSFALFFFAHKSSLYSLFVCCLVALRCRLLVASLFFFFRFEPLHLCLFACYVLLLFSHSLFHVAFFNIRRHSTTSSSSFCALLSSFFLFFFLSNNTLPRFSQHDRKRVVTVNGGTSLNDDVDGMLMGY